jgi:hypothetical protein
MPDIAGRSVLLDELIRGYMDPVMTGAGFRRVGRKFVLEADSGDAFALRVSSHDWSDTTVGFILEWDVATAVLRDFEGAATRSRAPALDGVVHTGRVEIPTELSDLRPSGREFPTQWDFPIAQGYQACGIALATMLEDELLPVWTAVIGDRASLVEWLSWDPGWSELLVPLVRVDDGPLEEMDASVAAYEADAATRPEQTRELRIAEFLRARIDARRAAGSV